MSTVLSKCLRRDFGIPCPNDARLGYKTCEDHYIKQKCRDEKSKKRKLEMVAKDPQVVRCSEACCTKELNKEDQNLGYKQCETHRAYNATQHKKNNAAYDAVILQLGGKCINPKCETQESRRYALSLNHKDPDTKYINKNGNRVDPKEMTRKQLRASVNRGELEILCICCHALDPNSNSSLSGTTNNNSRKRAYEHVAKRKMEVGRCLFMDDENTCCPRVVRADNVATFHYDHRDRDSKVLGISEMCCNGASNDDIDVEIAKCDLMCANCHFIKTQRNGDARHKYKKLKVEEVEE